MTNTQKKQILAVDDHPSNLKVLQGFVDKKLFDLTTTEDAPTAIKLCQQKQFDLILMDIQLPEMDGIEATKILKKITNYKNIPIIGITADAFKEIEQRALKAGMTEVMTKPIKLMPFRQRLIEILNIETNKKPTFYDKAEALKMTNGDSKLAEGILAAFIKQIDEQEQGLSTALKNKDLESIYFYAHKIHSGVCYCGIPLLLEKSKKLEKMALDKDDKSYQFTKELLKLITQIKQDIVTIPKLKSLYSK